MTAPGGLIGTVSRLSYSGDLQFRRWSRNGTAMTSGGGTQILAGHGSIHGPGHSATLTDGDGTVLFYHYYTDAGDARLGVNRLSWDSAGWPVVS